MSDSLPAAYVAMADGEMIRLIVSPSREAKSLTRLGFCAVNSERGAYERGVSSLQEKADVFSKLRDLGIAFSRGREWSPAEVFESLRDDGLIVGAFNEVAWSGPGDWTVRRNP